MFPFAPRAVADAVARGAAAQPVTLLPALAAALTLRLVGLPVRLLAVGAAVPGGVACRAAAQLVALPPATGALPCLCEVAQRVVVDDAEGIGQRGVCGPLHAMQESENVMGHVRHELTQLSVPRSRDLQRLGGKSSDGD